MNLRTKDNATEIVQVIIGTGGHVDHGKTSLVKALTGCDTDKLPEEKKRKLSINLGFAPCRLPGNRIVGIVDVPGHEDFIRNMVAGAASIDLLMLVIAADDGVMPQTVEHLQIVSLLRTPKVMVVLTKVDIVDADIREAVMLEVREFMEKMGYPGTPIVPFSAVTGEGIHQVRKTLDSLVSLISYSPDPRAFRMNIERVFSVKGYGTVVTGIPISGIARIGDVIELHPSGKNYIIRAIEAYKHNMSVAPAHSCAAINIRDIEPELLDRGMTIAAPGKYCSTQSVIADLKNTSEKFKLRRLTEAWFLSGTSKLKVIIRLLDRPSLPPGEEAIVHMKLSDPVVLVAGDRYIIRLLNPSTTFGGGRILSTEALSKKKKEKDREELLHKASKAVDDGNLLLSELLAGPHIVISQDQIRNYCHSSDGEVQDQINLLTSRGDLLKLGSGTFLIQEKLQNMINLVVKSLENYHRSHPDSFGIDMQHLYRLLHIDAKNLPELTKILVSSGKIVFNQGRYAIPTFKPVAKSYDTNFKERIEEFIEEGGISGQARGIVMKRFRLNDTRYKFFIRILQEEGLIKVFTNHLMHIKHFENIRELILEHFKKSDVLHISDLRNILKSGRHFAVDLLEALDAEGMTRRVREGRVLTKKWKKGVTH